ncbi:hypothetical protein RF11_05301 [Thelohanellus kitauei]|uniref:Integrase zinc-binding domain-containing protein n=1 Tax=Thelohanellus kitauei TaxID=669202 RepID=A0A0C2JI42_THEKT|nr:hypothetical protein RF11_05301 [Thelohanellus kitauei]
MVISHILRIGAWCIRFINNCKSLEFHGPLRIEEISCVKQRWIIFSQRSYYSQSYDSLLKKTPDDFCKRNSLFLDTDNIIRSKTRLNLSSLEYISCNHILLHRNSFLALLVIRSCHIEVHHGGLTQTLAEIRSKYWIPKCRSKIKSDQRLSRNVPTTTESPGKRITVHEYSGIDYFGPVICKVDHKEIKI